MTSYKFKINKKRMSGPLLTESNPNSQYSLNRFDIYFPNYIFNQLKIMKTLASDMAKILIRHSDVKYKAVTNKLKIVITVI